MDGGAVRTLCAEARKIPDPRVVARCDHLLVDVVAITVLAVICGADDWLSVHAFAVERQGWLKQFLKLPAGVPSHDTFGRVMGLIEPKQFTACLINWMSALQTALKGRVVAIDGKTARGSGRKQKGLRPIHIVSAWAIENGVMLGQLAVDEKSNEITAIPELLDVLAISGAIITLDAMGMQKEIVEKIRDKKAHYVIGLKDNQPKLNADMQQLAAEGFETGFANMQTDGCTTTETARGGVERRDIRVIALPEDSPHRSAWRDLNTLVIVNTQVVRNAEERCESRMYLSDLPPQARRLSGVIRQHWGIENTLHWSMDVTFREDHHRLEDRNGVQNLSAIRRMAVSILRQDKSSKVGAKTKRLKAALNPNYLLQILNDAVF
jgi:predicted transposase YbfD/YdcC